MRIFLTGATGYIGAAVLDALVRGGHDVTALVRDNSKAARIAARGGHPIVGNLADPESFRAAAEAQDGYIHTAYDSTSSGGPAIERAALESILAAAKRRRTAGSKSPGKRFIIYTSGVWVLGPRRNRPTRRRRLNPVSLVAWRPDHEQFVLAGRRRQSSHHRRSTGHRVRRRPRHRRRPSQVGLQRPGARRSATATITGRSCTTGISRICTRGWQRTTTRPASTTPTTRGTSA